MRPPAPRGYARADEPHLHRIPRMCSMSTTRGNCPGIAFCHGPYWTRLGCMWLEKWKALRERQLGLPPHHQPRLHRLDGRRARPESSGCWQAYLAAVAWTRPGRNLAIVAMLSHPHA